MGEANEGSTEEKSQSGSLDSFFFFLFFGWGGVGGGGGGAKVPKGLFSLRKAGFFFFPFFFPDGIRSLNFGMLRISRSIFSPHHERHVACSFFLSGSLFFFFPPFFFLFGTRSPHPGYGGGGGGRFGAGQDFGHFFFLLNKDTFFFFSPLSPFFFASVYSGWQQGVRVYQARSNFFFFSPPRSRWPDFFFSPSPPPFPLPSTSLNPC